MSLLSALLDTRGFMAHGYCYLWNRSLVRLHLISDLIIGVSYVAISLTLLYLVRRAKREIPFHWMFLAFGAFICPEPSSSLRHWRLRRLLLHCPLSFPEAYP
jgi:hypothetical protein